MREYGIEVIIRLAAGMIDVPYEGGQISRSSMRGTGSKTSFRSRMFDDVKIMDRHLWQTWTRLCHDHWCHW